MSVSSVVNNGITGRADQALSENAMNKDQFIKLLVAQVQNQDPTSPMDPTQFTQQLAMLSQVEQAAQTNKQLEALRSQLAISGALFETALIGREVTAASETLALGEGGGSFSYQMATDAGAVSAVITDAKGNVIRQIDGLPTKGGSLHDVTWDGLDNAGNPVEIGIYNVSLASKDGGGAYNTYTTAMVNSVEYGDEQFLVLADGRRIRSGDIIRAL